MPPSASRAIVLPTTLTMASAVSRRSLREGGEGVGRLARLAQDEEKRRSSSGELR